MNPEPILIDFPQLMTERLVLRRIGPDDLHDVFEYASNEEVVKYTTQSVHISLDDSRAFIERVQARYAAGESAPWGVVMRGDNKLIGHCGLSQVIAAYRRAELFYVLHQGYWNKGYVTEAAQAILDYGFEKLNLHRIQAICLPDNGASERVMQKIGMSYEGTLRDFTFTKGQYDTLKMYAILRPDWQAGR